MSKPMMKCGHAANATNQKGEQCCVICVGIHPGARLIDDSPPSLEGRTARCSYFRTCGHSRPSSIELAFFEYGNHGKPAEFDTYYCGCHGWD